MTEEQTIETEVENIVEIPELEKVKSELEKERKRRVDSEKWGQENRKKYMTSKKTIENSLRNIEEFIKNKVDTDELYEGDYEELKKHMNIDFENLPDDITDNKEDVKNPVMAAISNLAPLKDRYKEWSTDTNIDVNFNAFVNGFSLMTEKEAENELNYLNSKEDPKILIDYVLKKGKQYREDFFDEATKSGSAFSMVKSLKQQLQEAHEQIKELTSKVDPEEKEIYNKNIKSGGISRSPSKKKTSSPFSW